jgi:hypothetical protein
MIFNCCADVVEVSHCHSGIHANPKGVVHQAIGMSQIPDLPKSVTRRTHLVKTGLPDEISGEQHPGLHASGFQRGDQSISSGRRLGLY